MAIASDFLLSCYMLAVMNPFKYLGMLWHFSKARMIVLLALLVLSSLTQGISLLMLVPLLDVFQGSPEAAETLAGQIMRSAEAFGLPTTLSGLLATFLILMIARAGIVYAHTVQSEKLQLELLDDLRKTSFDAVLTASWAWHVTQKKSDISNLLLTEISRLSGAVMHSLRALVTVFSVLAYVLVAFALSFWLTLCALGFGALLFLALSRQHSLTRSYGKELTQTNKQVQQRVEEGLSAIKLIKALRIENGYSALMQDARDALRLRTMAYTRLNAVMSLIFQTLVAVGMATLLYVGTATFALSLSTLLVLVVLFARLAPQVLEFQRQYNGIMHAEAALENLRDVLEQAGHESEDSPENWPDQKPARSLPFTQAISLTGVSFTYKTRGESSLKNISLTLPSGKITAVMGPSGSGKSTLAELIMGLLAPQTGEITVDGAPLDASNRMIWRQKVAYMPQDTFLFHDTIRHNLKWAKEDATEAELTDALERAAAEFVFQLPEGLDTVVGDIGHRLSGGERQRIALARAILQHPQILILDEATSALDQDNEALIIDALHNQRERLTVLMLGHRESTLALADQLIVLERGQVKEVRKFEAATALNSDR